MGSIYNIQRFSLHDGPGVRTTVFLKGCPLRCLWCHNPESQSFLPDLLFHASKCSACLNCISSCPEQAISQNGNSIKTNAAVCTFCRKCLEACSFQAREIAGKEINCSELIKIISRDLAFYEQSGGGVTFSGGEPLSQSDFLLECLSACKNLDLHTTVDSSGYALEADLLKTSGFTDLFLYDLKVLDDTVHQKVTGVSNALILQNLKVLIEMRKRIFLRVPVIPGVNDQVADWQNLPDFIKSSTIEQVNLLPYHRIGSGKYASLGINNPMPDNLAVDSNQLNRLQNFFASKGFKTIIGG